MTKEEKLPVLKIVALKAQDEIENRAPISKIPSFFPLGAAILRPTAQGFDLVGLWFLNRILQSAFEFMSSSVLTGFGYDQR